MWKKKKKKESFTLIRNFLCLVLCIARDQNHLYSLTRSPYGAVSKSNQNHKSQPLAVCEARTSSAKCIPLYLGILSWSFFLERLLSPAEPHRYVCCQSYSFYPTPTLTSLSALASNKNVSVEMRNKLWRKTENGC